MWNCQHCKYDNPETTQTCQTCGEPRTKRASRHDALPNGNRTDSLNQALKRELDSCCALDPEATALVDLSMKIFNVGIVIGAIYGVISIVSSFILAGISREGGLSFFSTLIPGLISSGIFCAIAWVISVLVSAQANILQNTKNSAKLLELQTRIMLENQAGKD